MKVTVTNTGRHPTEAAGRVFPARATVEREVDPDRIGEVRDHGRLVIVTSDDGLDELTVDELKDAARKRELPVSGSKAELLERIRQHDAAQGTPAEDAPEGEPTGDQSGTPEGGTEPEASEGQA